jgi:hypothetical protein
VFLTLAEDPNINQAERQFYLGLNYFRLEEFEQANQDFQAVRDANHPELSASAAFYQGTMLFNQKKWKDAQAAFQDVLDRSSDPKMDERAEQYIELILRQSQFEAEQAKKFKVSGTFGAMYDSNILLTSDSALDQGTASDSAGYRALAMAGLEWRPVYETNKEMSVKFDLLNMYTVDDGMRRIQALKNADPLVMSLTAPMTYKGVMLGKGFKIDLVPGYETIYMSVEDNKTKPILGSYLLNFLNTVIVSDSWFTTYNIETRYDDSKLNSSTGVNDSTAVKGKGAFGNMIFLTKEKNKILTADIGHTINMAKGDAVKYNRSDLAIGYIAPAFWDMMWNARASYFLLNYPKNETRRVDNSYTLAGGVSKKLTSIWSLGVLGSYNINESNVQANQSRKFSVMTTLSGSYQF